MKIRQLAVLCLVIVITIVPGCKPGVKGYKPFAYKSQMGGSILYCRLSEGVQFLDDVNSPIGVMSPGSSIEVPRCQSWGILVLVGNMPGLAKEWNENKVPELTIVDRKPPRWMESDFTILSELKTITRLDLSFCPLITDNTLAHVANMKNLKTLYLPQDAKITDKAIADLKTKLPELKIETGIISNNFEEALNRS